VLLRINMCRLGTERRERDKTRARNLAVAVTVLGVNAVVVGLFAQALIATDAAREAAAVRLDRTELAMARVTGDGVTLDEEQVEILKARRELVDWGRALKRVATLTPDEVWFSRIIVTEGVPAGGGEPVLGLQLYGTLKAGRREEGVDRLMTFVQSLRNDPGFREDFNEAVLVAMNWTTEAGEDGVEFEVFCPLMRPDAGNF
jgi:hypothetical protein